MSHLVDKASKELIFVLSVLLSTDVDMYSYEMAATRYIGLLLNEFPGGITKNPKHFQPKDGINSAGGNDSQVPEMCTGK